RAVDLAQAAPVNDAQADRHAAGERRHVEHGKAKAARESGSAPYRDSRRNLSRGYDSTPCRKPNRGHATMTNSFRLALAFCGRVAALAALACAGATGALAADAKVLNVYNWSDYI